MSEQEPNPYASPAEGVAFPAVHPPVEAAKTASQGRRFGNFIIDIVVTWPLAMGVSFAVGIAYGFSKAIAHEPITEDEMAMLNTVDFLVSLGVRMGYFVLMESVFQRTIGKFATRTMVVDAKGRRPTFGQIVGRSFARLIPFDAFSFLGSRNPEGWHDSLSGTRVVETQ